MTCQGCEARREWMIKHARQAKERMQRVIARLTQAEQSADSTEQPTDSTEQPTDSDQQRAGSADQ